MTQSARDCSLMSEPKSQAEKFKDAARELGADEDEKRWEERLKKVAKSEPHTS